MRFTILTTVVMSFLLIHGCQRTHAGFDLDGFKSVKFGMTSAQLSAQGFECDTSKEPGAALCKKNNYESLFGKPVFLFFVYFGEEGNLQFMSANTSHFSNQDLIELYTESLGEPMIRNKGGQIVYMWISNQKNSILVRGENSIAGGAADYHSAESTKDILSKSIDQKIYKDDLKDF